VAENVSARARKRRIERRIDRHVEALSTAREVTVLGAEKLPAIEEITVPYEVLRDMWRRPMLMLSGALMIAVFSQAALVGVALWPLACVGVALCTLAGARTARSVLGARDRRAKRHAIRASLASTEPFPMEWDLVKLADGRTVEVSTIDMLRAGHGKVETMIFGGEHDGESWRCSSRDEGRYNHGLVTTCLALGQYDLIAKMLHEETLFTRGPRAASYSDSVRRSAAFALRVSREPNVRYDLRLPER
jgi:hypothetical protein